VVWVVLVTQLGQVELRSGRVRAPAGSLSIVDDIWSPTELRFKHEDLVGGGRSTGVGAH